LKITSLELLRIAGEDRGGNGIPDWLETFLAAGSGIDLPDLELIHHQVSPACIEGMWRLPGDADISVDGQPVTVNAAIDSGWYANVPLAPAGETLVRASFESGALVTQRRLVWIAVNPFIADERIEVRAGDSMKFAVPDTGDDERFSLTHDGQEVFKGPAGKEVIVTFARTGEHVIDVSLSGGSGETTRRMLVRAVAADFDPVFSLAAQSPRVWNLPGVPVDVHIEGPSHLSLTASSALSNGGRKTTALWNGSGAARPVVLARLGENGPVLASTRLNVFKLVDAAESGDAHLVEVLPDGTRVVEISYLIEGEIPADFSLWIDFIVTDAVFADGSTRYHLTAADFDETGTARVKIYKAPGSGHAFVCHWNRLYEDDEEDPSTPPGETEDGE
jgi:hypothetical protein